ncbi:hypothetical protein J3D54_004629 [Pseudomonas sp. GGS8]|uniref:virulence factor TspB C-terminal domain-related protein n=1 Tax=Pseudomonas sp. GGS8 TaxID=2817892 RepID=UPI00209F5165|nr:virulence factor TspB C-terminal domain-related protein [Pseudomonas sp. GGS8]MCP1445497.1 hypothetical protein [Pseudomonas sp. GGS8]
MSLLYRIKAVALFGCLLFSSRSFALDYFWSNGVGANGPNPSIACAADGQQVYAKNPNQAFAKSEVETLEGLSAYCRHYYTNTPASGADDTTKAYKGASSIITRRGDSCPTRTGPYDPVTGICKPQQQPQYEPGEKCKDQGTANPSNPKIWDDTVNACVNFTEAKGDAPCTYIANAGSLGTAYTVSGNLDKVGNAVAPPTFIDEILSCQVRTISSSECTINVKGAISCNVIGKLTGKANPAGDVNAADALCPNGKCPVKEPETQTKEEDCNLVSDGAGGSSCTESKKTETLGSQNCGLVNGEYKCVTRFPRSNGIGIKTNTSKQNLPDGSVQVTTVKNSTHTVCSDVNTCTEKTSTTMTKAITSPSGTTKTEASCKGTCTPDGNGLESNPNAGTGNGKGNGEEGGAGTASTTDDCTVPPPCDGDPFLCAVLKQQHIDTCKLMAGPTDQERSEMQGRIDVQKSAMQANQEAMDSKVNDLLGGFKSASTGVGSGGGKCLPDIKFSVLGHSLTLAFSKTCDALSFLRYAVLAAAYLFAARVVIREV